MGLIISNTPVMDKAEFIKGSTKKKIKKFFYFIFFLKRN